MQDFDEKKIFYSDEDKNFDLPLELIQDVYDKREDEMPLNSSENIETSKAKEDESLIDDVCETCETCYESYEEDKEEGQEVNQSEEIDLENDYDEDSYYLERIDEVQEILEEICESIPAYAFDHLNGGIILSEDKKYHAEARNDDLLIMGEYQRSILGNMIKIYYGSFMEMYRFSSRDRLKEKLEEVLLHEFTHHLEFLANEWGLVIEDEKFLEEYRKGIDNE
ncbi:metallopeptidase family protein [Peptoniphilus harei]|uniref:metallopeptidase family protein n=1 Tax=Peptoniphilus harei TaxID=54005 RepID=UPI00254CF07F|nr:metallopeptidase family protein [Peptoniphilus harei]MDK7377989.1 metallopeptidase family protein [Peptoniphilus harei]MDK7680298.1 metallopeptidase family protein [Peptoniphilus harei]